MGTISGTIQANMTANGNQVSVSMALSNPCPDPVTAQAVFTALKNALTAAGWQIASFQGSYTMPSTTPAPVALN